MKITDILKNVKHSTKDNLARLEIPALTDDSRNVTKGSLFIAKKGCSHDGAKFIEGAVKNGAAAIVSCGNFTVPKGVIRIKVGDAAKSLSVIADNFYGHPSAKLKVMGVTGTNGKTTISYLAESVIKAAGHKAGVIGTISYRFAGKAVPAKNTTPGAVELQSMMAAMVKSGARYAVLEVSSHSLDQGRADSVLLDAAVLTNVTGDHLDYHGTLANYFKAKRRIFEKLKDRGAAILNKDDRKAASLEKALRRSFKGSGRKVITYGCGADVRAEGVEILPRSMSFTVRTPDSKFGIKTGLIGQHNVSNILAVVAACSSLGMPDSAIVKGVEALPAVPGRLEAVNEGQPFRVFVDFAHTEDALLNVLGLLRGVSEKRIITVFGCGGDRDRTKRPRMGKAACKLSDRVIITSDNPRFEDPIRIFKDIEDGIRGSFSNYAVVADRRQAISEALGCARQGDVVIIAGKGHETCQIIRDEVIPFDDKTVATEILKGMYEGKRDS